MIPDLSSEEIDFAISVLTQLKESPSGAVESTAFWQFEHSRAQPSALSRSADVAPSTSEALHQLRQKLNRFKEVFEPILESLETSLEEVSVESGDAISTGAERQLPDEVLTSIFRWSSETDHFGPSKERTSTYKVMRLSHVCRHYRKVALSDSSLWASLDTRVPFQLLHFFMARAGSAPFMVYLIDRNDWNNEALRVLESVHQHANRWRDVFIRIDWLAGPLVKELKRTYLGLNVSSLRYLHLSGVPSLVDGDPEDEKQYDDSAELSSAFFLSTWELPVTARIERKRSARIEIPPPLLDATSLQLDLENGDALSRLKTKVYQLQRVSSLKIRCLDPSGYKFPGADRMHFSTRCMRSRNDYLVHLTDLSLDLVPAPPMATWRRRLYFTDIIYLMPGWRLSTFSFSCELLSTFQALLPHLGIWEGLEKLVLSIKFKKDYERLGFRSEDINMQEWCPVFPNLKSITFENNLPEPRRWLDSKDEFVLRQLTGLHEIVFKDCQQNLNNRCLASCSGEVIAKVWTASAFAPPGA